IGAYVNAGKAAPGLEPQGQSAGANFADLVKGAAESALQSGQNAESMTLQAIDGNAEVADVVTAIADAELALQTVVAIRDQVVQAYQEILRMPI
ncbi:MAG: flagellar hook-basal body complex protein FliE, partial [Alphaproteobacteria bacterium]